MNILPPLPRRQRDQGRNGSSVALATTLGLLGLISLLLGIAEGYLAAVMIGSVIGVVGSFHYLFGAGRAFSFALANLVGTYACIFLFFAQSNFDQVGPVGLSIGFLMPLPAFVLGSLRRRGDIQKVMLARRFQDERRFARVLLWLAPVFVIGVLTFLVPRGPGMEHVQLALLLIGMALVSAIVFCVSHDVAVFLLDTELLFAAFFRRIARLIVPAFAFLTFYSLLVILFASFYSIADYAAGAEFPHRRRGARTEFSRSAVFFADDAEHGRVRRYFTCDQPRAVHFGDRDCLRNPVASVRLQRDFQFRAGTSAAAPPCRRGTREGR